MSGVLDPQPTSAIGGHHQLTGTGARSDLIDAPIKRWILQQNLPLALVRAARVPPYDVRRDARNPGDESETLP